MRTHRRFPRGITQTSKGWRIYVGHAGKMYTRRLPPSTSYDTVISTQLTMRRRLKSGGITPDNKIAVRELRRSQTGWCYVYFVQQGGHVKIGRAVDVASRLSSLQTASVEPLTLLAAIPAHADLEPALHQRFRPLRRSGEWFEFTKELSDFIGRLKEGANPVALLWED